MLERSGVYTRPFQYSIEKLPRNNMETTETVGVTPGERVSRMIHRGYELLQSPATEMLLF